jgi:hypothetical protein
MITTALGPCPVCARHVRVSEDACPFCRTPLPSSFRKVTTPASPRERLSRAALYALRVGTLSATTAACGGGQTPGADDKLLPDGSESTFDASEESNDDGPSLIAPYGGSPIPTCNSSADCPSGETCAPQAGDPSIMVCTGCTSASTCQPGQVCCGERITSTTTCQAGPCPDVMGIGEQLCAISAECFTPGDTCTNVPLLGVGSMGLGGLNEADSGSTMRICTAPSDDGGAESGGEDADDASGGDAGPSDAPDGG